MAIYGHLCPDPASGTPYMQVASLQVPRCGPMAAYPIVISI